MTEHVDTFSVEALGVAAGANPVHVATEIALAFGIPEPSARAIVDRAPVRVKAGVDAATAKALGGKLLKAGVDVRILNERTGADRVYRSTEVGPPPEADRPSMPVIIVDRPAGAEALAKLLAQKQGGGARTSSADAHTSSQGRVGTGSNVTDLAAAAAMAMATPPPAAAPATTPSDAPFAGLADGLLASSTGSTSAPPVHPAGGSPSVPATGSNPPAADTSGSFAAQHGADASGPNAAVGSADASGTFAAQGRPSGSRDACGSCKKADRDRSGMCRACGYNNRDRKRHCRKCGKPELRLATVHVTRTRHVAMALGGVAVASLAATMFVDHAAGVILSAGLGAIAFWVARSAAYVCKACGEPAVGFSLPDAEEAPRKRIEKGGSAVAAALLVLAVLQPAPLLFRPTLTAKSVVTAKARAGRLARDKSERQASVRVARDVALVMHVAEAADHDGFVELFQLATAPYTAPAAMPGVPDTLVKSLLEGLVNGEPSGASTTLSNSNDHFVVEAPFEGSSGGTAPHVIYGRVRVHKLKDALVVTLAGGPSRSAASAGSVSSFLDDLVIDR